MPRELRTSEVAEVIRGRRYLFDSEAELQEAIAGVLEDEGVCFEREVPLTAADRVDFMAEGSIGIEVKTDGSLTALTRQLYRYAQSRHVAALIAVVTASRLRNLPGEMAGKPLVTVYLMESSF